MNKTTLTQKLSKIFFKSNREALNEISDALRDFDDKKLDGFHDRHEMPTRREVPTGPSYGANGDSSFAMQDEYGNDVAEDGLPAEYREFSHRLQEVAADLKAIKSGQAALAAVFHKLLKGDLEDEDAEDAPDDEEMEKALEHLRAGGEVPDGIEMSSKSVADVIEAVMGRSKGSSTPPSFRKGGTPPLHVRLNDAIAKGQDCGQLSLGDGMMAQTIVNRLVSVRRGEMAESLVTDALAKASPSVRSLFAAEGVSVRDSRSMVGAQ